MRMRRPNGWFLFALLAAAAPAAGDPSIPVPQVPLSVADRTVVMAQTHLTADRLEAFHDTGLLRAMGSVVLTDPARTLSADRLEMGARTGKVSAEGHVQLTDEAGALDAARIELDAATGLGTSTDATLFLKKESYLLSGERIARVAADRYELDGASFTACGCAPDWRLRARRLRLRVDGYLTARDVVFYANEWPVFYLPYFIYPAGTVRKTGLLVPHVGWNTRDGPGYRQELFWAISKHQDVTATLDDRGRKGSGGGLAHRYRLPHASGGAWQIDYFDDRKDGVDRWDAQYKHTQHLSERLQAAWDLRYLNRRNSLTELADDADERAQRQITSDAALTWRGDAANAWLLARYSQNLAAASDAATIQRLPEAGFRSDHSVGPLEIAMDGTAVNFWRRTGFRTPRADFGLMLAWPNVTPQAMITPWIGLRDTLYRRTLRSDHARTRPYFPMGVSVETTLARQWGAVRHQVRPRLNYHYLGLREVEGLHQFDEVDRLADRNAVTAALEQRLVTSGADGLPMERLFFRMSETYRLDRNRADLPDAASPLRGELRLQPTPALSLQADTFYDTRQRTLQALSGDVRFERTNLTLSLGHRYTRGGQIPKRGDRFDPLFLGAEETVQRTQFWRGGFSWKTGWGMQIAGRADFNADTNRLIQSAYGATWEDDCWGLTLSYIDFPNRDEFAVLLHLKGLTPLATSPIK